MSSALECACSTKHTATPGHGRRRSPATSATFHPACVVGAVSKTFMKTRESPKLISIPVGSFKNPPPGQPVDKPYDQSLKLGEKIENLDDEIARKNFRVVVIAPDEVESVDLSDPNTARRQLYKFNAADGSWSHQECWP